MNKAFTLIELSIVLVIIGLIVGGVLVGRDLVTSAAVRAQIAQLEKYNQAVNAFKGKYDELPGDMSATNAAKFGFLARAGTTGRGDGDGIIEGFHYTNSSWYGWNQEGETLFFWRDLSQAGLIAESFTTVTDAGPLPLTGTAMALYIPGAKIRSNDYVRVASYCQNGGGCFIPNGANASKNFFELTSITGLSGSGLPTAPDNGVSVSEAYKIDAKIDDGMATSGRVQAFYTSASSTVTPSYGLSASAPSATTCFDTTSNQYSVTQNNGSGVNCSISVQLQ